MSLNSESTLRLFSGDIFSPSPLSKFCKGDQFIPFLQKLKLHAAVIGNHEVDNGEENFIRLQKKSELAWLCSNCKSRSHKKNLGHCDTYKIVNIGGIKVGLFGLIDEDWFNASTLNINEYVLEDVKEKGREMSSLLKNLGCQLVIALTHMATSSDRILLKDEEN